MADPIKIEFLVERILADLLDTDLIAVDVPSGDTHKINLGQLISYISANGGFVDLTSNQTIGGVKTFSRDDAPPIIIRSLAATGTRIKFEGSDPATGVYVGRRPGSLGDFSVTIAGNADLTAYDLLVNSTGNVYGRVNATQATNENSLVRLGHLNTQLNSQTPNKPSDLGTSDLDTILTPGFYFQTTGGNATPERNYPVASAGSLTVLNGNGATGYIEQIFFPINQPGYWIRTQVNGVWGAWLDISASQGGGDVSSVFGRTGNVVAVIADYQAFYMDLTTAQTIAGVKTFADARAPSNIENNDALTRRGYVDSVVGVAQSTADTALTNAATADGKAVAAQATADSAASAAAAAQGTANTANGTANTALTNAATAQSTANTANGTANTALTNAATADSKAVAAQATADAALAANPAWVLEFTGSLGDNLPYTSLSGGALVQGDQVLCSITKGGAGNTALGVLLFNAGECSISLGEGSRIAFRASDAQIYGGGTWVNVYTKRGVI